ncbi:MAG: metallophosphoesterase [Desulfatitalea sp.]|nr:metallophosphoesterase family protein [Desulfatitalea sp.]NNK01890.1 metallophosphoesterase [Desulfatitalea sp.]
MKIYTVSDIHIDFHENHGWLTSLSSVDYQDDILILAGDIADAIESLKAAFEILSDTFHGVCYVPGNHDLWLRHGTWHDSMEKFHSILKLADQYGINTKPVEFGNVTIIPLFGWYDYSFGEPSVDLRRSWVDYVACRWEKGMNDDDITQYFLSLNERALEIKNRCVITFSHFVPRIDVMPSFIPKHRRYLYPVLGTNLLEHQIRRIHPRIHIYGHTHVNRQVKIDNITYINNAYGYPHEGAITRKKLFCVYSDEMI